MVLVIGRVQCSADQRERLVEVMERMQEASRNENGCLRYGFFSAVEDPLTFVAVEEWVDREALDRHFAEPHLQEFAQAVPGLISSEPEIAIHEIAGTSDFPG